MLGFFFHYLYCIFIVIIIIIRRFIIIIIRGVIVVGFRLVGIELKKRVVFLLFVLFSFVVVVGQLGLWTVILFGL